MSLVCGIDLGTQSCKILVYDPDSRKTVAAAGARLALAEGGDGSLEQRPQWFREALAECFASVPEKIRSGIAALGVSGQQHGFVPLDASGAPIRPAKLWCDTSTASQCKTLTEAVGGESALLAETGMPMRTGYTAPKVLWLKEREPASWSRLAHVLLPHDYLNFLLSGEYWTEAGDASGTALFDIRQRRWSERVCSLIDPELFSMLPGVAAPDRPAGEVGRKASEEFGIPRGALIAPGGGDNMMSAIGSGCVTHGALGASLGTSGTLYGHSDRPVVDEKARLAAFCSSTGGWLPLLCTMNCTVASEGTRALLGMERDEFESAASASEPGAGGILMLPFLRGERVPDLPDARASLHGITAANYTRGNLARASMEAALFAMRGGTEAFKDCGFEPKEIRLAGGGARSLLWRRMAADIFGITVLVPAGEESAAFGAALQALHCLEAPGGTLADLVAEHVTFSGSPIEPDLEHANRYAEAYSAYAALVAEAEAEASR